MLGVKVIEINNLNNIDSKGGVYCSLKVAGTEKKTRVIRGTKTPKWNKTFYFNIPSYSTNELLLKIINRRNDILSEINIPISYLKCGIVEEKWHNNIFHLITHLIQPGKLSFESNPFSPLVKTIHIQNLNSTPNVFCLNKLKDDEYWRYTKPGNFSDYFTYEYIKNSILCIKASDLKSYSEETFIDISKEEDKIIDNSFGKFKISIVKEINPFSISSIWKCNIFVDKVTNIIKEKDILWTVEINNNSLGFSFDGLFNKYISININSLQSDVIKIKLFKNENDSKKEYGVGFFNIYASQIGITENKNLKLFNSSKSSSNFKDNKIILKYHITPPEAEPFINKNYNPLIMHIYVIEAINIPKMDLTSKTDPYVVLRFEKDNFGVKTKHLDDT